MAKLSPNIQLEILNEVDAKSDGFNPVEIDCTDPDKKLNFRELQSNDCFVFFAGDEQMKIDFKYVSLRPNMKRSLAELSMKGHKRRFELIAQLAEERRQQEHDEHMRRQTEALEGANVRATCAMVISIVCALISTPSWAFVIEFWLKNLW